MAISKFGGASKTLPDSQKGKSTMKKLRIRIYPKDDLELTWLLNKERFDSGDPRYTTCMRCGKPMRPRLAENALSRAMNVPVCPDCGTDEALRDASGEIMPVSDWYIVKSHCFGEHESPDTSKLLSVCRFSKVFEQPKKCLPLSSTEYPISLVGYSRSDYDGRQWWTTWFTDDHIRLESEFAREIDAFQMAVLAHPDFKTLREMKRICRLYAQRTSEPTEFNLYSDTEHFYIWLRLITREKDYNLYISYYLKDSPPVNTSTEKDNTTNP